MHTLGRHASDPVIPANDDGARSSSSMVNAVVGDFPLQPPPPQIRTIEWSEFTGIRFLRHGTGTSLFAAYLCNNNTDSGLNTESVHGEASAERSARFLEPVVFKCPKWGLSASHTNEVTTELKHEAEMLARLNHPNIIKLTGVGTVPLRDGSSVYFLAVPLLVGGVLSDRLGTAPPPSAQTENANRQAEALALSALASPGGGDPPANASLPKGFRRKSIRGAASSGMTAVVPPTLPSGCKKMGLGTSLRVAEELAAALRYLHDCAEQGRAVLHRDLKPDNVGFGGEDEGDRVLLFDFGLVTSVPRAASAANPLNNSPTTAAEAKISSPTPSRATLPPIPNDVKRSPSSSPTQNSNRLPALPATTTNPTAPPSPMGASVMYRLPKYRLTGHTGSVRYMAPEVALDKPYNQSVDTYSFSIILWEMVFRKRPFTGMNVSLHRENVCLKGVRPALDKKIPADLADLLKASWHADSDRRPPFAVIEQRLHSLRLATDSKGALPAVEGGSGGGRDSPSPNPSPNSSMKGSGSTSWGSRASSMFSRKKAGASSSWF